MAVAFRMRSSDRPVGRMHISIPVIASLIPQTVNATVMTTNSTTLGVVPSTSERSTSQLPVAQNVIDFTTRPPDTTIGRERKFRSGSFESATLDRKTMKPDSSRKRFVEWWMNDGMNGDEYVTWINLSIGDKKDAVNNRDSNVYMHYEDNGSFFGSYERNIIGLSIAMLEKTDLDDWVEALKSSTGDVGPVLARAVLTYGLTTQMSEDDILDVADLYAKLSTTPLDITIDAPGRHDFVGRLSLVPVAPPSAEFDHRLTQEQHRLIWEALRYFDQDGGEVHSGIRDWLQKYIETEGNMDDGETCDPTSDADCATMSAHAGDARPSGFLAAALLLWRRN